MPCVLDDDDDDDLLNDMARPPDPDPPPFACSSPEHLCFDSPQPPPSTRPPAATPAPAATTFSTAPAPGVFSDIHTLDGSPTLTAIRPGDLLLLTDGHSSPLPRALCSLPELSDDDGSPSYRDILLRQLRATTLPQHRRRRRSTRQLRCPLFAPSWCCLHVARVGTASVLIGGAAGCPLRYPGRTSVPGAATAGAE